MVVHEKHDLDDAIALEFPDDDPHSAKVKAIPISPETPTVRPRAESPKPTPSAVPTMTAQAIYLRNRRIK